MGSGNVYLQPVNTNRNVKRCGSLRTLLLGGMLLAGMPLASIAQPTFQGGNSTPPIAVCQGGTYDPFSVLYVSDPAPAPPMSGNEVDTWDIVSGAGPSHGTVTGFPYSANSNGGTIPFPSGSVIYQPTSGYAGPDQFVIKVYDDISGDTVYKTVNIVVQPLPSFTITSIPAVCAGATTANLYYSSLSQLGPTTSTFAVGANTWVVPPNVFNVSFDVQGGVGGNDSHSPAGTSNPGAGARVQGTLTSLVPGSTLFINVGDRGGNGTLGGATGGWNGGGNASFYFFGCGGAGGGASDIRMYGNALGNRVVVAGGGAGNGWDAPGPSCGGNGGYDGAAGCNNVSGGHAGGGSTTLNSPGAGAAYPGWASGQNGSLGVGGNGSTQGISGGGGGGYYGGGGGVWSGGGGGSSYAAAGSTSSVTYTSGYNIGAGIVSLSYNIPGTYTIVWDLAAISAGFTNVAGASFPASPLSIAVPPTASAGTYTGNLQIANSSCTSNIYPISITINPIPDVAAMTNQSYCNGDPTTVDLFSGSVPGTVFNWTNDNPSIGLAASGTGNIGSFTATNTTSSPITALITVTPVANGCTGAPISFSITVNPTPTLTSTLLAGSICDSTIFNYNPTSATTGTTFTWYRNTISNIQVYGSTAGSSGSNNPGEPLDNTSPNAIVVPYTYVLAANGCLNSQVVTVTVNPLPTLSSSLTEGPICNNTLFSYGPSSLSGVSFMWNRNMVPGISNPAHVGTNNPNETLDNTTTAPIAVPYTYTLTLLSDTACFNTQVVTVTVNPTPMLNTALSIPAQCSNVPFTYVPGSGTTGSSFTWSRGATIGISNPPNSGADTINEAGGLNNTTPLPVTVTYTYTIMANGCSNNENITVTINPTPRLSSDLTPTICDSLPLNYPPTSATPGTTFTWTRAVVPGITNGPGSGFGNVNETLVNTTPNPVVVTYVFDLTAYGCSHNQNVNVTVNPKPTLSSTLTPPAICDSQLFSYNPTSNTADALFTWFRPYIPGIYAVQQSGTGNPNQDLVNSTYVVVNVVYTYTITANGCSNVQSVTVPVNPTPKLNPPYSATVCSGSPFVYIPTSYTPGATFAWDRPEQTYVGPATSFTGSGTGTVNETLVNTNPAMTPVNTYYYFRLGINGCTNLYPQVVKLTINPTPAMPAITTYPPNNLCSGTMYQNFGTAFVTEGIQYEWTATNAHVFAQGSNHQYALVSFENPGTAVVSINSNVNSYGCTIANTYTVNVGDGVSETPNVIYYNGQFICLKNDVDSYQWGYDDAYTLDSTIITGQIDQNYNNSNPDFGTKYYWVITKKGDCMQKSYYMVPSGIANVNSNTEADMKVYPNPASQTVNVEVNSLMGGDLQVQVLDVLGQRLATQPFVNNKASINVSELANGCYLLECYRNNVKVATTRFIKN